jgi:hypothetical protein
MELSIQPPKQVRVCTEARHAFVFDRRQHGAADHDLSTRVAPPLGAARQRRQTVSCSSQPRETFIKDLQARSDFLRSGLRDWFG